MFSVVIFLSNRYRLGKAGTQQNGPENRNRRDSGPRPPPDAESIHQIWLICEGGTQYIVRGPKSACKDAPPSVRGVCAAPTPAKGFFRRNPRFRRIAKLRDGSRDRPLACSGAFPGASLGFGFCLDHGLAGFGVVLAQAAFNQIIPTPRIAGRSEQFDGGTFPLGPGVLTLGFP